MKKIYPLIMLLFIAAYSFGQSLENPKKNAIKMKMPSQTLNKPVYSKELSSSTKNGVVVDTIGLDFFSNYFDINEMGAPYMGNKIAISGTDYGYVDRIYQEYYFQQTDDLGEYKITDILIKFWGKSKNTANSNISSQKVYLYKINKNDSSYTRLDSTTFTYDEIDTLNQNFIFRNLTSIPFPNLSNLSVKLNSECVGVAVKLVDLDSSFRKNQDTAWQMVSIFPDAQEYSCFWRTSKGAGYIFFYDKNQMLNMFLVADDVTGIVGGKGYIDGMQLSVNPNPAPNGATSISYALNKEMNVKIQIMDATGKLIESVDEGSKQAGTYNVKFGNSLSKGIYYYSLIGNGKFITKKLIVE